MAIAKERAATKKSDYEMDIENYYGMENPFNTIGGNKTINPKINDYDLESNLELLCQTPF
mgnify:CR=1 FL=1